MSDQATSTPGGAEGVDLKGKGKAVDQPQDMSMDEDDDESDEPGDEEGVEAEVEEEEDEDNMEEISTENIISGRRTRGTKDIDYAKAAAEAEDLEDDEDDDDDFQAQEDDAMQE